MYNSTGFDRISSIYDLLVSLVFGGSMRRAQAFFLNKINPSSNVLVLGGGTGLWLEKFLVNHPQCSLVYIDASEKMIALAKQKISVADRIEFRHGTQDSVVEVNHFDAVITFCYLDLFEEAKLKDVIKRIAISMKPDAQWLVVDFVEEKSWHHWMLFLMYRFFGLVAGLKNLKLPDWNGALQGGGVMEEEVKFLYGGFIKSALMKCRTDSARIQIDVNFFK
jgi:tRNA (cmo5U34)-methyltransferase